MMRIAARMAARVAHTTAHCSTNARLAGPPCRASSELSVNISRAAVSFLVPTEASMQSLGSVWATVRCPADVYLLDGAIGAGKSSFSRAYIRHACGEDIPVPSPTYLLMNCYEEVMAGPSIRHFDLYRLEPGSNLERLGIQEAMGEDICLIEWPSRLPSAPENAISVSLAILNPEQQERMANALAPPLRARTLAAAAAGRIDDGAYADNRWRLVTFSSDVHDLVQRVEQGLAAVEDDDSGLLLLEDAQLECIRP